MHPPVAAAGFPDWSAAALVAGTLGALALGWWWTHVPGTGQPAPPGASRPDQLTPAGVLRPNHIVPTGQLSLLGPTMAPGLSVPPTDKRPPTATIHRGNALWCSAIVVGDRHVLSAAHCLFANPNGCDGQLLPVGPGEGSPGPRERRERVSVRQEDDAATIVSVTALPLNESLEESCRKGPDLALIEVDRTLDRRGLPVRIPPLARLGEALDQVRAYAYGPTPDSTGGALSCWRLTASSKPDFVAYFGARRFIAIEDMVVGWNPCGSDSGGPLVSRGKKEWLLLGAISGSEVYTCSPVRGWAKAGNVLPHRSALCETLGLSDLCGPVHPSTDAGDKECRPKRVRGAADR